MGKSEAALDSFWDTTGAHWLPLVGKATQDSSRIYLEIESSTALLYGASPTRWME